METSSIGTLEEIRKRQWQEKIAELEVPDEYGYVIEKGIRETVAALQLLGISTSQSCEGDKAIYPWIQFEAVTPRDVYVGEEELKNKIMDEKGISPDEINPKSKSFNRGKQVDVEGDARDALVVSNAPFTPEFEEYRKKTAEYVKKLQGFIEDFYKESIGGNSNVYINFPYRDSEHDKYPYIKDVPFLEVKSKEDVDLENLSEEERKKLNLEYRNEMKKFTEFLKDAFFKGE